MKFTTVLPFVALAATFVIPDEKVLSQVAVESHNEKQSLLDKLPSKDDFFTEVESVFDTVKNSVKTSFDDLRESATEHIHAATEEVEDVYMDASTWLGEEQQEEDDDNDDDEDEGHGGHGHHGGHGRHGKHGRHGGHHHKPNLTVYELISKSKYTTKLAKLINEFDDLVELLNSTKANFTIFAPTDRAFEKIPDHGKKPSKEFLKKVLAYHVSDSFYPAGRVLGSQTIPTLLNGEGLVPDGEKRPQRLSVSINLRGLTLNFYSRVVAINIFGTNGVIHGVDSILVPPPTVARAIAFLPGQFSTLELGLLKTDLLSVIGDTSNHRGGTFFAPTNFAFKLLGPRANGFLFSKYGQKYLKALLKYHVVANATLYSDEFYGPSSTKITTSTNHFHADLPSLLDGKILRVDVARFARFVTIRVNGFTDVTEPDLVAYDGVIQPIGRVLIPPRDSSSVDEEYTGGEISEEELIERLEPYVEKEETSFGLWPDL